MFRRQLQFLKFVYCVKVWRGCSAKAKNFQIRFIKYSDVIPKKYVRKNQTIKLKKC